MAINEEDWKKEFIEAAKSAIGIDLFDLEKKAEEINFEKLKTDGFEVVFRQARAQANSKFVEEDFLEKTNLARSAWIKSAEETLKNEYINEINKRLSELEAALIVANKELEEAKELTFDEKTKTYRSKETYSKEEQEKIKAAHDKSINISNHLKDAKKARDKIYNAFDMKVPEVGKVKQSKAKNILEDSAPPLPGNAPIFKKKTETPELPPRSEKKKEPDLKKTPPPLPPRVREAKNIIEDSAPPLPGNAPIFKKKTEAPELPPRSEKKTEAPELPPRSEKKKEPDLKKTPPPLPPRVREVKKENNKFTQERYKPGLETIEEGNEPSQAELESRLKNLEKEIENNAEKLDAFKKMRVDAMRVGGEYRKSYMGEIDDFISAMDSQYKKLSALYKESKDQEGFSTRCVELQDKLWEQSAEAEKLKSAKLEASMKRNIEGEPIGEGIENIESNKLTPENLRSTAYEVPDLEIEEEKVIDSSLEDKNESEINKSIEGEPIGEGIENIASNELTPENLRSTAYATPDPSIEEVIDSSLESEEELIEIDTDDYKAKKTQESKIIFIYQNQLEHMKQQIERTKKALTDAANQKQIENLTSKLNLLKNKQQELQKLIGLDPSTLSIPKGVYDNDLMYKRFLAWLRDNNTFMAPKNREILTITHIPEEKTRPLVPFGSLSSDKDDDGKILLVSVKTPGPLTPGLDSAVKKDIKKVNLSETIDNIETLLEQEIRRELGQTFNEKEFKDKIQFVDSDEGNRVQRKFNPNLPPRSRGDLEVKVYQSSYRIVDQLDEKQQPKPNCVQFKGTLSDLDNPIFLAQYAHDIVNMVNIAKGNQVYKIPDVIQGETRQNLINALHIASKTLEKGVSLKIKNADGTEELKPTKESYDDNYYKDVCQKMMQEKSEDFEFELPATKLTKNITAAFTKGFQAAEGKCKTVGTPEMATVVSDPTIRKGGPASGS